MEIHFAPIQGQTDLIYRNIFDKHFGGVDCYYTPFIRLEKGLLRKKDMRESVKESNTVKMLVPQILPGNPEEFRILVGKLKEYGYNRLDINLGCPFPMVTGSGRGAGMLAQPEKVKELLETIKEFPDIRFSVKARLGYEDCSELLNIIEYINTLPLVHITIHPRTAKQQYKGEVDMATFRKLYNTCTLPIIYNGDILTAEQALSIEREFPKIKGIMLGRGLLTNPHLAKEILGEAMLTLAEERRAIKAFHADLYREYQATLQGEKQTVMRMQGIWEYLRVTDGDPRMLKKLMKCTTLANYSGYQAAYTK